jgi:hypothetical protein
MEAARCAYWKHSLAKSVPRRERVDWRLNYLVAAGCELIRRRNWQWQQSC